MPDEAMQQVLNVQAQWVVDTFAAVPFANQMLLQLAAPAVPNGEPDAVYVTIGHLTPPVINTPPGQPVDPQSFEGMVVPVQPVARFAISRARLLAFSEQIQTMLAETETLGR